MKPPLICSGCGKPLDKIYNAEDSYPVYGWDETQARYVLIYEGSAHMECPECGSNIQRDFVFDIPDGFSISIQDTTDPIEAEEVNVNGTVYSNAEIDSDEWYREYIEAKFKLLLEHGSNELQITLLERGESEADRYFQDFCIELKDGSEFEMVDIINWWRANRG